MDPDLVRAERFQRAIRWRRRWTTLATAMAENTAPVRVVGVVLLLGGTGAAVLATRAWHHGAADSFLAWSLVGLFGTTLAVLLLCPGRLLLRAVGVVVAAALVAGIVVWQGVWTPQREVAAAYSGTGVAWSVAVPEDWEVGPDAGTDDLKVISEDRAVVTQGDQVLVVDTTSGRTVSTLRAPLRSTQWGDRVARTVDGFVLIEAVNQWAFYDADGQALGEPVTGEDLIARAPGVSVVQECPTGECTAIAVADDGEELWRHDGYERPSLVPTTDRMPVSYSYELLDVVPAHALLRKASDEPPHQGRDYDERDPDTGDVVRTFAARWAGSGLDFDGSSTTFALRVDDTRGRRDCTVRAWPDDQQSTSESETCGDPLAVIGKRLLVSDRTTLAYDLAAVDEPWDVVFPEVDTANTTKPIIVHDAGPGGIALPGRNDATSPWETDPRAVSGRGWGTDRGDRWTHHADGRVISTLVGNGSVLVASRVVPLNPRDRPGADEREFTVLDLDGGHVTANLRLRQWPDSFGLSPDGGALLVVDGRIIRLG